MRRASLVLLLTACEDPGPLRDDTGDSGDTGGDTATAAWVEEPEPATTHLADPAPEAVLLLPSQARTGHEHLQAGARDVDAGTDDHGTSGDGTATAGAAGAIRLLAPDAAPTWVLDELVVDSATAWEDAFARVGEVLPSDAWTDLDEDPAGPWWVLPDRGPAVQATVAEVILDDIGGCDAVPAWVARLDVSLPDHARAVAVAHGVPPASWHENVPGPTLSRSEAEALLATVPVPEGGTREQHLGVDGTTWRGRVLWWRGYVGAHDVPKVAELVEVTLHDDGRVTELSRTGMAEADVWSDRVRAPLVAHRDVDGDGVPDRVLSDGCHEGLEGPDGWRLTSRMRCCGC